MTQQQIDNILNLKQYSEGEIYTTPHLLLILLRTYSEIYLNGKAPGTCEKCFKNYYDKLMQTKLIMTTCKLQPNKIFHVRVGNAILTYSNSNITDEVARRLLNEGSLKEHDFVELPVKLEPPTEKIEQKAQQPKRKKK